MSSIKKNILYNVVYQVLIIMLPLLTAPYLSRILGVKGIGYYSYSNSIASYFILFGMLGISSYGNRSIALKKNKAEKGKEFSQIYTLQIVTTTFSLVIYFLIIVNFNETYRNIMIIQAISVVSAIFDVNWLFFGLEKFKITVTRNIIIKIIAVILIFSFVKDNNDLYVYTFIMAGSSLLSQLILWLQIKKNLNVKVPQFLNLKSNFKSAVVLFIPVLAYSVYKIMDKIMLGSLIDMTQVGYYENAEKFINIPISFITAFGTVMMPRISRLISNSDTGSVKKYNELSFKYFTVVIIPIFMGLASVANILAPVFYGQEFRYCGILISFLSVTLLFTTWSNIIRTQYLIPNKKDKPYVLSTILGAIINFGVNLLLIPDLKAMGAVIGTIAAEATVFLAQAIWVRKEFPVFQLIKNTWRFFIYGTIMTVAVYFIGKFIGSGIITLIVQISVGAFIYVLFIVVDLYLNNDQVIRKILKGL